MTEYRVFIDSDPLFDHTTKSSKGWFLYIRARPPTVSREVARIKSRVPSPSTAGCFSMYYHAYGSQAGYLRVELTTTTNKKKFLAWRTYGFGTVDGWQQVSINIPATTTEVTVQTILQNVP